MKLLSLLLALFLISNTFGQRKDTEYYFGFNLMPDHGGSLITYAIVHVKDGKVVGSTPYPLAKWIRLIGGEQISPANPEHENLFMKYGIDSCSILYDAEYYKYDVKKYVGYECSIIDNLWKIRYQKHPYEHNKEGWSTDHYKPNGDQWAFLYRFYGVGHQTTFFYGKNMWQLFKDMMDPDWVSFYQAGDLTWKPITIDAFEEKSDSTATE